MRAEGYSDRPDYGVPPGWILQEILETENLSQAEFARRCGRSPKLISEIVNGIAPIEPRTAILFEKVLGIPAGTWTNLESMYRLHLAQEEERKELESQVEWAKSFPIAELTSLGMMPKCKNPTEKVAALHKFLGVGSIEAYKQRYRKIAAGFRHAPAIKSKWESVVSWLRIGEMKAAEVETEPYNARQFRAVLPEIRSLTVLEPAIFEPRMKELCRSTGVVLLFAPPLKGMRLNGAARWLPGGKPVIQQSPCWKSKDIFWFTFFHEAAHILLHTRKDVFVDEETHGKANELDDEANTFAGDFLIPRNAWDVFEATGAFGETAVKNFAGMQGIHPSIVIGRLRKEDMIERSSKRRARSRHLPS